MPDVHLIAEIRQCPVPCFHPDTPDPRNGEATLKLSEGCDRISFPRREGRPMGPVLSGEAAPATWLQEGIVGFGESVASLLPCVFEGYARVFHPALATIGGGQRPIRWDTVARALGTHSPPADAVGQYFGRRTQCGLESGAG